MPPSPIPAPLPPWARAAIQVLPYVTGWLYDTLTYHNGAPTVMQWRRLQCRAHVISGSAVVQDDAIMSWDIVNITGGNVDNSWTTSDYTTCEALFDTFWTTYKPYMYSGASITEYRWYLREFSSLPGGTPGTPGYKAFLDGGPPQRVTVKSIAGTGSSANAPQVSMTVTEKTAWPKHWGRVYLPFLANVALAGFRYGSGQIDTIAAAASTLHTGLQTAEFFPVVPVTQIAKDPARALLNVTQIQIDDLPDVVRRRRPRNTLYRKVLP